MKQIKDLRIFEVAHQNGGDPRFESGRAQIIF